MGSLKHLPDFCAPTSEALPSFLGASLGLGARCDALSALPLPLESRLKSRPPARGAEWEVFGWDGCNIL